MTKKEMIAELVSLGADESEIKDLKNPELEDMLEKARKASLPSEQEEPKVEEQEETKYTDKQAKTETDSAEPEADKSEGEVVRETSQQLGIFKDYIYNVKHKGAKVVIENLGYGDVYYNTEDLAVVGKSERLMFSQSVTLEGVTQVCFASASQPVVQIIEIK